MDWLLYLEELVVLEVQRLAREAELQQILQEVLLLRRSQGAAGIQLLILLLVRKYINDKISREDFILVNLDFTMSLNVL